MEITIPVRPNRYGEHDHWESDHVLAFRPRSAGERLPDRYGIGFVGPDGLARHVTGGPQLPGPYAYLFGLSVTIDNFGGTGAERRRGLAAGIEHDLRVGDVVEIRGYRFEVTVDRWKEKQLTSVDGDRLTEHLTHDHGWLTPLPGSSPSDVEAQHRIAHEQEVAS